MKTQHLMIALTLANASMLIYSMARPRYSASAQQIPAVIRGRALEIVDDHDRVRAELKVFPAQPDLKMPDGTKGYPETVLLRLISSQGGPNVKLSTLEDGSGMVLGGEKGYVQVLSRKNDPFIKLVQKSGKEQTIGGATGR